MTKNQVHLNTNPRAVTLKNLQMLRLPGMAAAYSQQFDNPDYAKLTFDDRIGIIVKEEIEQRTIKRKQRRLKESGIREGDPANINEMIYSSERGLDEALVKELAECSWITCERPSNLLVAGASGTGKTWLIKALGKCACEKELTVAYYRMIDLAEKLAELRSEHNVRAFTQRLQKKKLLIIDDFAMGDSPCKALSTDLLRIIDSRQGVASTIVAAQRNWMDWHSWINDPATADAIMDRLLNYSYMIELKGRSLRELK